MIITCWVKYELMNEWAKEQTIKKPLSFICLFFLQIYKQNQINSEIQNVHAEKNINLESSWNSIVYNNIDWIL